MADVPYNTKVYVKPWGRKLLKKLRNIRHICMYLCDGNGEIWLKNGPDEISILFGLCGDVARGRRKDWGQNDVYMVYFSEFQLLKITEIDLKITLSVNNLEIFFIFFIRWWIVSLQLLWPWLWNTNFGALKVGRDEELLTRINGFQAIVNFTTFSDFLWEKFKAQQLLVLFQPIYH